MSLCFSFQTHSLFGGRTRRRRQAGGFQIAPGFCCAGRERQTAFFGILSEERSAERGIAIPAFAGMTGVCVSSRPSERRFLSVVPGERTSARPGTHTPQSLDGSRSMDPRLRGDDRCVSARQPQTNAAVIPAKRATASASRDPVIPTVRCRQTGVTGPRLRGDDGCVCWHAWG
jgi:hypothetical protein